MRRIRHLIRACGEWAASGVDTPNGLDLRRMVAFVGDSITEGIISDPMPSTRADSFAALCAAELHEFGVATWNAGVGGATSRDTDPNDRIANDVHYLYNRRGLGGMFTNPPAANVAVIYTGTNDAVAFFEGAGGLPPTPVAEYRAHLIDIIGTLHVRGVADFVLCSPPIANGWLNTPAAGLMRGYADVCRELAGQAREVRLVDLAATYPVSDWHGAAIHPTISGHSYIASEVMAALRDVLGFP